MPVKVVLKTIQLCFFIGVLIVLVFYVVLLCVFTFLIPQCEAPFEFHINTMFGSSLSLVVCRRNHVLFTLFVFFYVYCCVFFFLCLRLVHPNVASFSGLSTFFLSLQCSDIDVFISLVKHKMWIFLFFLVCRSFLCQHIF